MANPNIVNVATINGESVGYNLTATTTTTLMTVSSGKVLKVEEWGMLNFASKIKNYNRGYYIHYKFEGNASTLNQIKKNSNIDGSILRHLTIKYKKLDLEKEYFNKSEKLNEKKK